MGFEHRFHFTSNSFLQSKVRLLAQFRMKKSILLNLKKWEMVLRIACEKLFSNINLWIEHSASAYIIHGCKARSPCPASVWRGRCRRYWSVVAVEAI